MVGGGAGPGALAQVRGSLPGCELAVLADIVSGTVLAWDGALKFPQEHLDALCEAAMAAFAPALGPEASTAILASPTATRVFLRRLDAPDEALCLCCAPGLPVDRALRAGLGMLEAGT